MVIRKNKILGILRLFLVSLFFRFYVKNIFPWLNSDLKNKSDSGHTHSYLPLSGGKISGNLDVTGNISVSASDTETADIVFNRPTNYDYDCHMDILNNLFRMYRFDKSGNYKDLLHINLETGALFPGTPIAIEQGGTGASTASEARINLGLGRHEICNGRTTLNAMTQLAINLSAYKGCRYLLSFHLGGLYGITVYGSSVYITTYIASNNMYSLTSNGHDLYITTKEADYCTFH